MVQNVFVNLENSTAPLEGLSFAAPYERRNLSDIPRLGSPVQGSSLLKLLTASEGEDLVS